MLQMNAHERILLVVVGQIFEETLAEGIIKLLHFFEWAPKTAEVVVAVATRLCCMALVGPKRFWAFQIAEAVSAASREARFRLMLPMVRHFFRALSPCD